MNNNLILLPGNSKRSGAWLELVDQEMAPLFNKTYRHSYAHRETGEPEINLAHETKLLETVTSDLRPYMIFAKSAGTILTLKATAEGTLVPNACLFIGLPLVMITDHKLPAMEWLQKTDFPITILQQTNDPYGSYHDVERYVASANRPNLTVNELPGKTHDYLDLNALKAAALLHLL